MRIQVDVDRCIGSGQCVMVAADVFDQDDDDGTVVLLVDEVGDDQEASVREAAASCPARVIHLDG